MDEATMLQSAPLADYLLYFVALWLATLTWIWTRHLREDEIKERNLRELMLGQEKRLERIMARVDAAMAEIRAYQTEFNLATAKDLAEMKADLRQVLGQR